MAANKGACVHHLPQPEVMHRQSKTHARSHSHSQPNALRWRASRGLRQTRPRVTRACGRGGTGNCPKSMEPGDGSCGVRHRWRPDRHSRTIQRAIEHLRRLRQASQQHLFGVRLLSLTQGAGAGDAMSPGQMAGGRQVMPILKAAGMPVRRELPPPCG